MGTASAPPPPTTAPTRWVWLIALLALLLRIPLLDRPVWFDEACMSSQRIGTTAQWLATLYVDIHPPGFVTFMHVWGRWFGDGELAMRLPALVSGLLAIPALFWAGRRWIGERAALWACLWLALSPVHLWYSVEARLYTPMLLCAVLSLGTTDRLMEPATAGEHRRGLWCCHWLLVVGMLLLHYYLAVWVAMLIVVAPWLAGRLRGPAMRLVSGHTLALLLLVAFVIAKRVLGKFETSQDYLRTLDFAEAGSFVFDWCWTGHVFLGVGGALAVAGWLFVLLGVLLMPLGLVAIARTAPARRPLLVLVGLLTVPLFLMGCGLLGYGRTYLERSTIASLPFVLLLAARGLMVMPPRPRQAIAILVLLLQAGSVIALYLHHRTAWTVYKPNADWRGASAWLGAEIDSGGAGRCVYTSTPNPRSLSYYDARIQDDKNLALPIDPQRLGAQVGRQLGSGLGGLAARLMQEFADHNRALRDGAKLVCHRSQSDPAAMLATARGKDDICYLLRDVWHPPQGKDDSVEDLLDNPSVKVLDTYHSYGIRVHKVQILP